MRGLFAGSDAIKCLTALSATAGESTDIRIFPTTNGGTEWPRITDRPGQRLTGRVENVTLAILT